MKGSGGWSDSLTCSIGGCRCRRGYRGGRSGISCRSSPLLLLAQRGLFPCLPQPMLLLQFQSETRIVARLIKKNKREREKEKKFLDQRFSRYSDRQYSSNEASRVSLTSRASRETWVRGTRAVTCPDYILVRTEDTKVTQEIMAVSAFHTVPNTTVPLIWWSRTRCLLFDERRAFARMNDYMIRYL